MNSYSIRKVMKFNITEKIEIKRTENSSKVIGTIIPSKKNGVTDTQKINGEQFEVFNCEFYVEKHGDIIVDGTPYTEFKVINPFKLYFSNRSGLLIGHVGLSIATPFLKYLKDSNPSIVNYSYINFDFTNIVRNKALVDQVWFGTTDVHARTKGFNGTEVNKNKEAMKAINDGKATYIKVSIDVNSNGINKKRIVGFSKKSGIVIVKKNDPSIDTLEKELSLLMDTYKTYSEFK